MAADPRGDRQGPGDREDPAADHDRRDGQRAEPRQLPDDVGQLLRDLGDQQGRVHPPIPEAQPAGVVVRRRHRQVPTALRCVMKFCTEVRHVALTPSSVSMICLVNEHSGLPPPNVL